MAIHSLKECPNCGGDHKGKPFAIYEDGWHCFSCGAHKRSDRDFIATRKNIDTSLKFPKRGQFSLEALKWLKQFHLSDSMLQRYGIYESVDGGITMPICDHSGKIVRINQRWLNPRRDFTQGDYKLKPIIEHNTDNIVLVEDYLSFIRVGESFSVCCLFGTNLDNPTLQTLVSKYNHIVLWLDNDHDRKDGRNPGQEAAEKIKCRVDRIIHNKYGLSSKKVSNIRTDKDPKYYTDTQIKKELTCCTVEQTDSY